MSDTITLADLAYDDDYLDAAFDGYLECALWSSVDDDGDPLDDMYCADDIALETRQRMEEDLRRFVDQARPSKKWWLPSQVGHDFWLTRNGHGAGFWDRYWRPDEEEGEREGERLSALSRAWPEFDLYVGDDGYLHGI